VRQAPRSNPAQELLGDFARFWHAEPNPAERRKPLASLFDRVWQDKGTIVAVKLRPAFAGYFKAIEQAGEVPKSRPKARGDKASRVRGLPPAESDEIKVWGVPPWDDHP
jgi:hypothetical protein